MMKGRPGLGEVALDGPDGVGGREVQVDDRVGVQDDRGQRLAIRGELADPVAQGGGRREEQRPGEPDDEHARRPTGGRAPVDVGEVVALEAPEFGDVQLAARRKTLNAAIRAATPTPTSVPYSTTQAAATIAMRALAGLEPPDPGDVAGLDEVQCSGQDDGAEGRIGSIASGPVRNRRTAATAPAAMIPVSCVWDPAASAAWVREALELTG